MAQLFDIEEIELSEVMEGLTAIALAPVVLPAAAILDQPLAKAALKEGIAFSQRCQEAVAAAKERLEDVMAEVKAELETKTDTKTTYSTNGRSEVAVETEMAMSELNEQVKQLTNNVADLRVLMPIGLGALALRQLLVKGIQLDEIPWYTLAWYAFDTFVKMNDIDFDGRDSKLEILKPPADETASLSN